MTVTSPLHAPNMRSDKKQITRTRISYSCQTCRRRKVKCDKQHPFCGACQKTGEPCIYDDEKDTVASADTPGNLQSKKRKKAFDDGYDSLANLSVQNISIIERQLAELTRLLQDACHIDTAGSQQLPNKSQPGAGHDNSTPNATEPESLTPESLHARNEINYDSPLRNGASTTPSGFTSHRDRTTTPETNTPSLSKIAETLNSLNQSLRLSVKGPASPPCSRVVPIYNPTSNSTTRAQLREDSPINDLQDDVVSLVPADEQSNLLFRIWLTSVYPILPFVDPFETLRKYEAFHNWYRNDFDRGVPDPVLDARPLIVAVYYAGTLGLSVRALTRWFPGLSRKALLAAFRMHYRKSLSLARSQSIDAVAARVMMWHMCPEQNDNIQSGTEFATIIRSAQSLGLHRRLTRDVSPSEYEIRWRLFKEIVNIDVFLTSSRGLPPLLSENYFASTCPSDIKDHQHGTPIARAYLASLQHQDTTPQSPDDPAEFSRSSLISVHNLVSQARSEVAKSVSRLSSLGMGAKPMSIDDLGEMIRIMTACDEIIVPIIQRIPADGEPELELAPKMESPGQSTATDYTNVMGDNLERTQVQYLVGQDPAIQSSNMAFINQIKISTTAFHKWARLTLSMALDQMHCYSYAPFLRTGKKQLWRLARQCALKCSTSFLHKYIALATEIELERFRWTAIPMYQPMHASAILLVDLYENPFSKEAARSRALIDQMLSLEYPSYGIVGGENGLTYTGPLGVCGPEAQALFRQLRFKAWQRAGLDPTLLWTEEDQTRVNVAVPLNQYDKVAPCIREDSIPVATFEGAKDAQEFIARFRKQVGCASNGELYHPSEAGIPPEHECDGPLFVAKEPDGPPSALHRARHDQPPVPYYLTETTAEQWHYVPKERDLGFRGINELIGKIKSSHAPPSILQDNEAHATQTSVHSERRGLDPVQNPSPSNGHLPDGRYDAIKHAGQGPLAQDTARPTTWSQTTNHAPVGQWNVHDPRTQHGLRETSEAAPTVVGPYEYSVSGSSLASTGSIAVNGEMQQIDYNFDFDWNQWDSVFGVIDDTIMQDMIRSDVDGIADQLGIPRF